MTKQLHIATSPLTKTIYCGNVLKDNMTWAANKQDVTDDEKTLKMFYKNRVQEEEVK